MRETITIPISAAGGSDDVQYYRYGYADPARIVAMRLMPAETLAGHAANYWDLSIDVDSVEIASEQNTVADLNGVTAGTAVDLASTTNPASEELTDGSVIAVKKTEAGSMSIDGAVHIEIDRYRTA